MGKNIVLIGFMGTGKSTTGLRLAEKLKLHFIDMDREIEKLTGMTITDIFRRYGEIRFRSEEQLMAQKLCTQKNLVIAAGGGVVLKEETIALLQTNGVLVCLEAKPQYILERVNRKKGTRPLLKKDMQMEDIEEMLAIRKPLYSKADHCIDTSGKNIDAVVNEIISRLKQTQIL